MAKNIRILIVNSEKESCGVFQMGYQIYLILKELPYEVLHTKIGNGNQLVEKIKEYNPTHIMINWHQGTLSWIITNQLMTYIKHNFSVKFWLMPHDEIIAFNRDIIDHIFWLDPTKQCIEYESTLGRPVNLIEPIKTDKLIVGYAGFCFRHKCVERIKDIVGDLQCHLRFHFAKCDYGQDIVYEAYIKDLFPEAEFRHEPLSYKQLTEFLAGNTINIFPYSENSPNIGISSIIDNALSSNKPFMISSSSQFRHLSEIDHLINYNKISITDCLNNGIDHLKPYQEKWSPQNMRKVVSSAL